MKKNIFNQNNILLTLLGLTIIYSFYSYFSGGLIYLLFQGELSEVVQQINEFGRFATIIFILIIALEVVVAPIPSILLYTAGGIIFGSVYGSIIILIGNILGSAIAYYLSKTLLREYFEKKIPEKQLTRFNKYVEKYGVYAIFLLRVNPLTSSDVFSYIAGLTKLRFWPFIIGTSLGLLPLIFIQAYIGEAILENQIALITFTIISIAYILVFVYFMIRKNK
ncbi:MAG: TVP38/TMEM64 family protein [Candidatus Woesearchaeota archaeon]